jgi:ATP-dependent DNA ligase
MEARSAENIPAGDGWQYEPKWDGFRCIAFRDGEQIYLQSKAGQPLARYFPDIVGALARLPEQQFVLDGELVVPVSGAFSFDALQLRLHPAASRVQKLAKANPAMYIVFDLLAESGQVYVQRILRERRRLLEKFARSNFRSIKNLRLSPATTDYRTATNWFKKVGGDLDGIIAKYLDAAYAAGERTAAVKVKQIRTADCVVGGFRYARGARVVGSLLLGLYGEDATRPADPAAGAPIALASGNQSLPKQLWKSPTTISRAVGSGTAQSFFAGVRTKHLASARSIKWRIAKGNHSCSYSGKHSTAFEL